MKILYLMAGAFLLDLCFGDPESMPHVVRLIGLLMLFFTQKSHRENGYKEKRYCKHTRKYRRYIGVTG